MEVNTNTQIDVLGILKKFAADLVPRLERAVLEAYDAVNVSCTTICASPKHGEQHPYKPIIFRHHFHEIRVRDLSELAGLDLNVTAAALADSISRQHVAFDGDVLLTFAAPRGVFSEDESIVGVLGTNKCVSVRVICQFDMKRGAHVIRADTIVALENRPGTVEVLTQVDHFGHWEDESPA